MLSFRLETWDGQDQKGIRMNATGRLAGLFSQQQEDNATKAVLMVWNIHSMLKKNNKKITTKLKKNT